MSEPALAFRSGFYHTWRVSTLWTGALAAGLLAFGHVQVPQIFVTLSSAVVIAALLAAPIASFRVYLSSEGIRCYDFFGIYHLAKWHSIEEVRPVNLLGLKYLRVHSTDCPRALWVPQFLSDMAGFGEAITRLAGPDNPLVQSWPREARPAARRA